MAMALMLQELIAEGFGSGDADSGDVLTANGSGGASWEAAQPLNIGDFIGYADTTSDIEALFVTRFGRASQNGHICLVFIDGMEAFAIKSFIWLVFFLTA